MMMSSVARASVAKLPVSTLFPRAAVVSRFFSIENDMKLKESAEESKFIREREKALLDMKHANEQSELQKKFAAEGHTGDIELEAAYDAKVTLTVGEVKSMLEGGDNLSAETLLKIAKWKLVE